MGFLTVLNLGCQKGSLTDYPMGYQMGLRMVFLRMVTHLGYQKDWCSDYLTDLMMVYPRLAKHLVTLKGYLTGCLMVKNLVFPRLEKQKGLKKENHLGW